MHEEVQVHDPLLLHGGHPVITETVHETLARVNLADEDPEDLLKGRTVCTEAFIALKHLATRQHNSDVTVLK